MYLHVFPPVDFCPYCPVAVKIEIHLNVSGMCHRTKKILDILINDKVSEQHQVVSIDMHRPGISALKRDRMISYPLQIICSATVINNMLKMKMGLLWNQ